jgi:3-hydroxyisobutyrate dehydrogenase
MVGHGHEDVDFSILLLETAKDAGMILVSENKVIDDGLQAK